jgi:hypothetical protein
MPLQRLHGSFALRQRQVTDQHSNLPFSGALEQDLYRHACMCGCFHHHARQPVVERPISRMLLLLLLRRQQRVHGARPGIPIAASRRCCCCSSCLERLERRLLRLLLLLLPVLAVLPVRQAALLLPLPLHRRQLLRQLLVRAAHLLPQGQHVLRRLLLVLQTPAQAGVVLAHGCPRVLEELVQVLNSQLTTLCDSRHGNSGNTHTQTPAVSP